MNSQLVAQQEGKKFLRFRFLSKPNSWKSSGDDSSKYQSFNSKLSESLLGIAHMSLKVAQVTIPHAEVNDFSTEVHDSLPKFEELEYHPKLEEPCSKISTPFPDSKCDNVPPEDCHNLSPRMERKLSELKFRRQDRVEECLAEIFVFPPPDVFTIPFEDEEFGEASESQNEVSPSFTRSNFLLKYGGKLTEAGKSFNDWEMYLLYKDIFKPLDSSLFY